MQYSTTSVKLSQACPNNYGVPYHEAKYAAAQHSHCDAMVPTKLPLE